jgi:hypothetical protein
MEDRLDRVEKILETMAVRMDKTEDVFNKRIEALTARHEALTARHEALSESVEMLVQGLFRRGKDSSQ